MELLVRGVLILRHLKSWERRKSNFLYYCNGCEEYIRNYQLDFKKATCTTYVEVRRQLTKRMFGAHEEICPHCLSEDTTDVGHNDTRGSRRPWLDYDSKSPKLSVVAYVNHKMVLDRLNKNKREIEDIEHFVTHNKLALPLTNKEGIRND